MILSSPLTAWASLLPSRESEIYYRSISWSVSVLTILPMAFGLSLKYYLDIPVLFNQLLSQIATASEESKKRDFSLSLARRFGNAYVPIGAFVLTLALNYVYFYQHIRNNGANSWMSGDGHCEWILPAPGLSTIGVYAATIQVVLVYWLLNVIWNSFVYSSCLHRFFSQFGDDISLDPLHPDRCCGLRQIGEVSTLFSFLVFLMGLYISLKVIDKTILQGKYLFDDIGNPLFLACYAVLAPVLFFLPLSAAHGLMQREKDRFLEPMARRCRELLSAFCEKTTEEEVNSYHRLTAVYVEVEGRIPVWPFNLRSVQAFFATAVAPVVPVALPLILETIKRVRP